MQAGSVVMQSQNSRNTHHGIIAAPPREFKKASPCPGWQGGKLNFRKKLITLDAGREYVFEEVSCLDPPIPAHRPYLQASIQGDDDGRKLRGWICIGKVAA